MNNIDLCDWLRVNSSGIYRPSAEAAAVIESLEADNKVLTAKVKELEAFIESKRPVIVKGRDGNDVAII
jgi:hypothetical protein